MKSNNKISWNGRPLRQFFQLASCAIASLMSFGIIQPATASETVFLRYYSQSISVPLSDLEAFAASGETTNTLGEFLEEIPLEGTRFQELLNRQISDLGKLLGPNDLRFLAIQYSKMVGDPLGRPITEPIVEALQESFADDRHLTILEFLQNYDGDQVRVDLPMLDRESESFDRFVRRIEPILELATVLLPEIVCECEVENVSDSAQFCQKQLLASTSLLSLNSVSNDRTTDLEGDSIHNLTAQSRVKLPDIPGAEKVTVKYGILTIDFRVDDLTTFAETGEYPRIWNTYFNFANISPEAFRAALVKEIAVDPIELNQHLNSLLGEYVLFQISRVIHGQAQNSNIQVLRSSLMRSALSEERLTFLEFLQNFPLPVVIIEGLNLKRFSNNVSQQGLVGTTTTGLEDMLLELQSEAANKICDCPEK